MCLSGEGLFHPRGQKGSDVLSGAALNGQHTLKVSAHGLKIPLAGQRGAWPGRREGSDVGAESRLLLGNASPGTAAMKERKRRDFPVAPTARREPVSCRTRSGAGYPSWVLEESVHTREPVQILVSAPGMPFRIRLCGAGAAGEPHAAERGTSSSPAPGGGLVPRSAVRLLAQPRGVETPGAQPAPALGTPQLPHGASPEMGRGRRGGRSHRDPLCPVTPRWARGTSVLSRTAPRAEFAPHTPAEGTEVPQTSFKCKSCTWGGRMPGTSIG